jgi:signal transduction histidine kinase
MESALRRDLRRYPLYFLIWTILGLFYFSRGLTHRVLYNDPTPWWHYLLTWLAGCYIWALLTPWILWLGRRFSIDRDNWALRIALHVLLSAVFSVLHLALESVISPVLGIFPAVLKTVESAFVYLLPRGFHGGVMTYWGVLGVQWGILYYGKYKERTEEALELQLRASELRSQLMRARLSAMKMQLQPHFLFNTLNAIVVLVRQHKGREAEAMLGQLSDLLRCVLDDVEALEIPLRRELYLGIEQVRFKDRLRAEISADPEVLDAAVPQLGLQPLVENAIRHGIGRSSSAGRVRISASRVNASLELRIEDDGPGFSAEASSSEKGIGLANTRARLQQLYGEAAKLSVEKAPGGGAIVTMTVPYRVVPATSETERVEVHGSDDAGR